MLRIHSRVAWQVVDGEAMVLDLERGHSFGFNRTGTFVWTRLGGNDLEHVTEELAAAFGVDRDRAGQDVAEFVDVLMRRGLLEEAPPA